MNNPEKKPKKPQKFKVSERMRMFVKEYLIDLNQTQAAIRAGYSKKSASQQGTLLMGYPWVKKAIDKAINKRSLVIEITAENVLKELAKLGFSNMNNYYDDDGELIPVNELDPVAAASITEVTEDVMKSDGDSEVVRRKYKIADKKGSLELLGKHLKLFTDKIEQETTITVTRKEYKQNDS